MSFLPVVSDTTTIYKWALPNYESTFYTAISIRELYPVTINVNNGIFVMPYIIQMPTDATKYRILVFDKSGGLTAVITDAIQFNFVDVVNGGSARGSFTMYKKFIDINWFNYDYRVQLYLEDSDINTDPWYDGFISEFDPSSQDPDVENITIYTDGWQTFLDRAIVSEILSPGMQPNGVDNGDWYADAYLIHLVTTYMDSNAFQPAFVDSIPVYLDALNFTGQGLGKCIDDIVKQVSDNTGHLFEWWVRGVANGLPRLIIQPQANPQVVVGDTYITPTLQAMADYLTEIKDETMYNYTVQNSASSVVNMIALYGGTDPITQQQVYSPYKDSTSISLYGVRQARVTNNNLLSQKSLDNYGTVYLLDNAYPQPKGSFIKYIATDYARAGRWFKVITKGWDDTGETFVQADGASVAQSLPQIFSQFRSVEVDIALGGSGDRITQTVQLQAPRPFADNSQYNAIINSRIDQAALASRTGPTQVKTYFLQAGLEWIA